MRRTGGCGTATREAIMDELWFRSELKEIGRSECLELLERISVGRVGYSSSEGTVVLPVNHAIIGGGVVCSVVAYWWAPPSVFDKNPPACPGAHANEHEEGMQTRLRLLMGGW